MISRIPATLAALAGTTGAALAHPGHVADLGHGHSHWPALAILGGLGIALAGWCLVRSLRATRRERKQT